MPVGAPNSAARWLSENIDSIPTHHTHALIGWRRGEAFVILSGTKDECEPMCAGDDMSHVLCELDHYRQFSKAPAE